MRTCPQDLLVGGHLVPRGATVWLDVWGMHRSRTIWKGAAMFSPEKWLGGAVAGAEGGSVGSGADSGGEDRVKPEAAAMPRKVGGWVAGWLGGWVTG